MPPSSTITPAGVLTVPFGVVEVCHAGTSLTEPQSKVTVPPRLGLWTFSSPSPESSPASSVIATTCAPVRCAIDDASPTWSPCPCVTTIASGDELVGARRRLRVAGQERVDQHRDAVVGQLERRVAEKADLHLRQLSCSWV